MSVFCGARICHVLLLTVYVFFMISFPQLVYYFERYDNQFFQEWVHFIKYPVVALGLFATLFLLIVKRKSSWRKVIAVIVIVVLMIGYIVWNSNFYLPFFWSVYCSVWHIGTGVLLTVLTFKFFKMFGYPFAKVIGLTVSVGTVVILMTEIITGLYFDNGCFDQADIAYSLLGMMAGFVVYLGVFENDPRYSLQKYGLKCKTYVEYFKTPFSLLVFFAVLFLLYVFVSSKLTSPRYYLFVPVGTFSLTLLVLLVVHYWNKVVRFFVLGFIGGGLALQLGFFVKYRSEGIIYNSWGLSVYKGIPVVFFDYVIYPNGWLRLIDKKHDFSKMDQKMIRAIESDVVIFGTGSHGLGGKQIMGKDFWKGREIFILKSKEAAKLYNQLIQVGRKKILLIMHNTC